LRLNKEKLADLLGRVPMAGTTQNKSTDVFIELPLLGRAFGRLRIEEATPAFELRCPDVKVYRGRGAGPDVSSVQLSWSTSLGLHALISSRRVHVLIQPDKPAHTQTYIVYDARRQRPAISEQPDTDRADPANPLGERSVAPSSLQPSAKAIEEVTVERSCFGCEYSYKLTLRHRGTAILAMHGNLKDGTVNHTCTAAVARESFTQLLAMIDRSGFFSLQDSYRDARTADGAVTITSVLAQGQRATVLNSNRAGPETLASIEDAIDAIGREATWTSARRSPATALPRR
jgi:hypothetical protein